MHDLKEPVIAKERRTSDCGNPFPMGFAEISGVQIATAAEPPRNDGGKACGVRKVGYLCRKSGFFMVKEAANNEKSLFLKIQLFPVEHF